MPGNLLHPLLEGSGSGGGGAVSLVLSVHTAPGVVSVSLPTLAPLATKVRATVISGGGGSPATGVAECAGAGASGEVHRAIFDIADLPDPVIIYIGAGGDVSDPVRLGEGVPSMFNCGNNPDSFTGVGDYGLFATGGGAPAAVAADTAVAVGGSPVNGPLDIVALYAESLIESVDWEVSAPGQDFAGSGHALYGIMAMQGMPGIPKNTILTPGGSVAGAGASGAEAEATARLGNSGCVLLELW